MAAPPARGAAAEDLTISMADAISDRATVVCVSAVQFATRQPHRAAALVARAHAVGAPVVIDVTQMAGAAPVSMTEWGADALVCSGYKWLSAPGGVALLAVAEDLADAVPALVGWKGSAAPFDFRSQHPALARDARRFELSTSSYSAAMGLLASIELLSATGTVSIREHAAALATYLVHQAAPLGWTPYRDPVSPLASGHIVVLRNTGAVASQIQARLAADHKISTSSRGGGIRVSLHAYNCSDDIHALIAALASSGSARRPDLPPLRNDPLGGFRARDVPSTGRDEGLM
jgi:cysteine desulfurase / selenocysteine lyase